MKWWVGALLLLARAPLAADVYKCTSKDGTMVFSDRPCQHGATTERVEIELPVVSHASGGLRPGERALLEARDQRQQELLKARHESAKKLKEQGRLERMAAHHQVIPGMTWRQVRRAWGPPDGITEDLYDWGTEERWVYKIDKKEKRTIRFRNGVVTSIKN